MLSSHAQLTDDEMIFVIDDNFEGDPFCELYIRIHKLAKKCEANPVLPAGFIFCDNRTEPVAENILDELKKIFASREFSYLKPYNICLAFYKKRNEEKFFPKWQDSSKNEKSRYGGLIVANPEDEVILEQQLLQGEYSILKKNSSAPSFVDDPTLAERLSPPSSPRAPVRVRTSINFFERIDRVVEEVKEYFWQPAVQFCMKVLDACFKFFSGYRADSIAPQADEVSSPSQTIRGSIASKISPHIEPKRVGDAKDVAIRMLTPVAPLTSRACMDVEEECEVKSLGSFTRNP